MGRMRAFYLVYSISPQAVGKLEDLPIFNIPWGHNIAIFEGVKSLDERLWYVNIEKDLEDGLLKHVEKFLSELGQGFSFVGRQVNLIVGNKDFYIYLLFYYLKLGFLL